MILNREQVRKRYGRTARFYDAALLGYRLTGIDRHRREVVAQLHLKSGDMVVDLGCGTGANFAALVESVGSGGRVVGVDLSEAMLARARQRIDRNGWKNVELIEADVREYAFPPQMAAAIAAFTLEMVPEYDAVISRIAASLPDNGRLGLLGLKHPENWPEWLITFGVWLNKPFGVSRDYANFRPWEAVQQSMRVIEFQELYFGAAYRCIGERHKPHI